MLLEQNKKTGNAKRVPDAHQMSLSLRKVTPLKATSLFAPLTEDCVLVFDVFG